jgi:hypothetical protein
LPQGTLERTFPEFAAYLGQRQFYNCHRVSEPDYQAFGGIFITSPFKMALFSARINRLKSVLP